MAIPGRKPPAPEPAPASETTWTPELNPAMTALLDHLAEELALEYVRLMEAAARASGPDGDHEEK